MSNIHVYANPATKPPLDASFYNLQPDELDFFQKLTRINDVDQLKKHIIDVQTKAYEIYGYPCIRSFGFTRLKIARLPGYKEALRLLERHKRPILLDMGCCFGNDARKAVFDGWPVNNVIAADLHQGFWDYGHELFRSTPETFPAGFVPGDIFDPDILDARGTVNIALMDDPGAFPGSTTPPLQDLSSLNPLRGKISAIHVSAFFHLFDENKQLLAARALASLLSVEKGSVIFGQHMAAPVKGYKAMFARHASGDDASPDGPMPMLTMFGHSPESWKRMWIEEVFGRVGGESAEAFKVDAHLIEVVRKDLVGRINLETEDHRMYLLNWSITRL